LGQSPETLSLPVSSAGSTSGAGDTERGCAGQALARPEPLGSAIRSL